MTDVIKIRHLTKDYGKGRGIFDFNLAVKQGQIHGLMGTNGSGKTTTMRHLMGFLSPDSGNCEMNGFDCRKNTSQIMKDVGYVPGQIDFPDVGTGTSFLKIQAQYLGMKDTAYMEELIDRFKIDTSAPLKRMSKGMKQKMALVAAFMAKPSILLLDEPSTGLDPVMRDALIDVIVEQKQRGATIFMSSHIFKELEDTCDAVTFIHNGHIVNTIDRSLYDEDMSRLYRIGFGDKKEYFQFKLNSNFQIESSNDKYLHMVVYVPGNKLNDFVRGLANYNMRYMRYIPYNLEMYYKTLSLQNHVN